MNMTVENYLYPTEFLLGRKIPDSIKLCCLDIVVYQTKIRPDPRDTPFLDGFKLFIDDSSTMIQGRRHNAYLLVDGKNEKSLSQEDYPTTGWLRPVNCLHSIRP
jgi:hypothetical protein